MSQWTSGQLPEGFGALALPVPKVRVRPIPRELAVVTIPFRSPMTGLTFDWPLFSRLEVVTLDVPAIFFDPVFDLRVEMMLYRYKRASIGSPRSGNAKHKAWVHPAHGQQVSGWTRGGAHFDANGNLIDMSLRPSEWPVTAPNQVIDVTQGPAGRFVVKDASDPTGPFIYKDFNGNQLEVTEGHYLMHGRYAYERGPQRARIPVRVAFRYTIKDLQSSDFPDRISGPMSPSVVSHPRRTGIFYTEPDPSFVAPSSTKTTKYPHNVKLYDATDRVINTSYIGLHFWVGEKQGS